MTRKEIVKMLKTEKEIVALTPQAQAVFASIGLELAYKGVYPLAKITNGWSK